VAAALAGRPALVTSAHKGCVVVFDEESGIGTMNRSWFLALPNHQRPLWTPSPPFMGERAGVRWHPSSRKGPGDGGQLNKLNRSG